jgi:hypothetical protein
MKSLSELPPWQQALARRIMENPDVYRDFLLIQPRRYERADWEFARQLLQQLNGGSAVEVVVPVVEVKDGNTTRAHQEPHNDEHDAEEQLTADDHDDPRDHERHGDEP